MGSLQQCSSSVVASVANAEGTGITAIGVSAPKDWAREPIAWSRPSGLNVLKEVAPSTQSAETGRNSQIDLTGPTGQTAQIALNATVSNGAIEVKEPIASTVMTGLADLTGLTEWREVIETVATEETKPIDLTDQSGQIDLTGRTDQSEWNGLLEGNAQIGEMTELAVRVVPTVMIRIQPSGTAERIGANVSFGLMACCVIRTRLMAHRWKIRKVLGTLVMP